MCCLGGRDFARQDDRPGRRGRVMRRAVCTPAVRKVTAWGSRTPSWRGTVIGMRCRFPQVRFR